MISNTQSKALYTGNGATTQFPFSFRVWEPDQILVTVTDAVLRAPDSAISVSDGRNIRFEHVRFDTLDGAVRLKTDGPLTENIRFADCTPEVR